MSKIKQSSPVHPAIQDVYANSGGKRKPAQRLACTCHGCDRQVQLIWPGEQRTAKQFFAEAERRGWYIDEANGVYLCDSRDHPKTEKAMAPEKTNPRQPTPDQRRAIVKRLDECYDTANKRYVPPFTDKALGEELKMPWAWVASIRDDFYGPPGPPPVADEIQKALAELRDRVAKLETDALAVLEKAERDAESIRAEIVKIEGKLATLLKVTA